jgi:dihydroneopterin aldolase
MIQIAGVIVNRDVMEYHTHESNYVKYLPLQLHFELGLSGENKELEELLKGSQVFSLLEQAERKKYTDTIDTYAKEIAAIKDERDELRERLESIRKLVVNKDVTVYEDLDYDDW